MDTPKEDKTLYETPNSQIFWKNFLAGFGKGLGGLAVQLVLFFLFYLYFIYYIMPKIQPLLNLIPNAQQKEEKSSGGLLDQFMNPGSSDTIELDTPKQTR
jgi:hypothetical protein